MEPKRVSDVTFGKLTIKYGRELLYEWEIGEHLFVYPNTRQLTSQRKFRDKYLEAFGVALLRCSTEAWTMIVNQAYATTERKSIHELEERWLRRVAQYMCEQKTDDQRKIARGKVYETNTGLVFTSAGLVRFLDRFEDMQVFTTEWHHEKLRQLLNVRSASMSLKDFKGRAMKLNNYSARVDPRFYDYCEEAA